MQPLCWEKVATICHLTNRTQLPSFTPGEPSRREGRCSGRPPSAALLGTSAPALTLHTASLPLMSNSRRATRGRGGPLVWHAVAQGPRQGLRAPEGRRRMIKARPLWRDRAFERMLAEGGAGRATQPAGQNVTLSCRPPLQV
ncbi:hypothetical protein F0U63_25480 [Cystobacter fuscus]|nr:hypothetical protein F0U63_25480 [Cystobacter fuscus]